MNPLIVAIALIQLHSPTGAHIDVNLAQIISIREPSAMPEGHWAKGVHCVIYADSKAHIAVRETCAEVRHAVSEASRR